MNSEQEKKLDELIQRVDKIHTVLANQSVEVKQVDDIDSAFLTIDLFLKDAEYIMEHSSNRASLHERLGYIMQRVGQLLLVEMLRLKHPRYFSSKSEDEDKGKHTQEQKV